jgi:hypothetical protein
MSSKKVMLLILILARVDQMCCETKRVAHPCSIGLVKEAYKISQSLHTSRPFRRDRFYGQMNQILLQEEKKSNLFFFHYVQHKQRQGKRMV